MFDEFCIAENKKRFCGFPIGVNMLPRFAAIVCKTTTYIINSDFLIFESNKIEKGTKVNNATSFVINMLKKKHKKTKMPHKALQDFTFEHKNSPQKSKILQSFNPAQTVIKEKSKNKTLKSI